MMTILLKFPNIGYKASVSELARIQMAFRLPRSVSGQWALEGAVGADTNRNTPELVLSKSVLPRSKNVSHDILYYY